MMEQAVEFIRKYNSFILTAHLNPEGDAVGATLGLVHILRGMGKEAAAWFREPVPKNTAFMPGAAEALNRIEDLPGAEAAIVLDCGDIDRPGDEFKDFVADLPVLNIDHHRTNTGFGRANWVEPDASSTGEMIAKLAEALKAEVSAEAALCLLTAILTDTGSFQFSNASAASLEAAARMVRAGARPEIAALNYYHSKPASHLKLAALVLATLEFDPGCRRGEVVATSEMFEQTDTGPDALEGLVNMITDVDSAVVAVLFRQVGPDKWKISMRSKGEIDVARVANSFGGGGHKNAAGATIEAPLDEIKQKVRAALDPAIAGS